MKKARLEKLLKIAKYFEREEKKAIKQLLQQKISLSEQQKTLDNLRGYRQHYQNELNLSAFDGINISKLGNYRQFISNIDMAVAQHEAMVKSTRAQYNIAHRTWKMRSNKLNAVNRLAERVRLSLAHYEELGMQKSLDDLVMQRHQKSRKPPPD